MITKNTIYQYDNYGRLITSFTDYIQVTKATGMQSHNIRKHDRWLVIPSTDKAPEFIAPIALYQDILTPVSEVRTDHHKQRNTFSSVRALASALGKYHTDNNVLSAILNSRPINCRRYILIK